MGYEVNHVRVKLIMVEGQTFRFGLIALSRGEVGELSDQRDHIENYYDRQGSKE